MKRLQVIVAACLAAAVAGGCGRERPGPPGGPAGARIVAYSPALAEMLFDMGLGEQVVGVTKFARLPEGVGRPVVGDRFHVNAEAILAVEPDVVVIQQDPGDFQPLLTVRGDVRVEHFEIETLADAAEAVERLGRIAGREDVGRQARERFEARLEAVRRRVADRPRPRVMFVMGYDRPSTAGRGSFIEQLIELAGGANAAGYAVRWPRTNAEAILRAQPEVLICQVDPGREDDARRYWQKLADLPAVRDGRVHVVTDPHWTIPSLRIADIAERLAALLHPEAATRESPS
jgi:iron complex transport system substrate-binding protein